MQPGPVFGAIKKEVIKWLSENSDASQDEVIAKVKELIQKANA